MRIVLSLCYGVRMGDLALAGEHSDGAEGSWAPIGPANARQLAQRSARARLKLRLAEERGVRKTLEEYIPGVMQRMAERQDLMDKVGATLDEALDKKDWEAVKVLTTLTKASFDEDKRLLDRFYGTAVARSESSVTQTVVHTNIRDLVAGESIIDVEPVEVVDVDHS